MLDLSHGSFVVLVDYENRDKRLDAFVSTLFPDISRNSISRLIRLGEITVHHTIKKPNFRLSPGDLITGNIPAMETSVHPIPEAMDIPVLFEDEALLIVNKPPGLVVHPSPGHAQGTLVNWLLYHHPPISGVGGFPNRPGIVHRLDRDTSGVLAVAKTEHAYIDLISQFKERLVTKTYLGLIYGNIEKDGGQIILPIGRHGKDRKKMGISSSSNARYAETHWTIRQRFKQASLVEFNIKTGRTHQIRVHCAAIRHPIVGDPVYGYKKPGRLFDNSPMLKKTMQTIPRQMLHAWRLRLSHPETGASLQFEAPLPGDITAVIAALREGCIA